MIETIIVDDEINARENLRYLTLSYCPDIKIVYEASNVSDAIKAIENYNPKLIFLDIEMPQKNGFQLIEYFKKINFYVIFITAYDSYAINAFKVSALDYILKPIEIKQLKIAVKKAKNAIEQDNLNQKVELLKKNRNKLKKIAVPYKSDYVIIDVEDILYIKADRMYSVIYLVSGKKYTASKKLSFYENSLKELDFIHRVHRSWIINLNHVYSYSKRDKNITFINDFQIPLSKSYKGDFNDIFKRN